MVVKTVFVLGGYGNFGKRIVEALATCEGITIFVAGRRLSMAQALCQQLQQIPSSAKLESICIDINSPNFLSDLASVAPDLIIHTGGPFQGQDYRVPSACLAIGCHYIDLADDRRFVCDIESFNEQAIAKNVLLVSGASSVPGLSSTVIDHLKSEFASIEVIDFAIAPGNRAERGEATIKGILSYTGHGFPVYVGGRWLNLFGWMHPRRRDFGELIGRRWLANVDIPDLELFPKRYQSVKTVRFQAGLELFFLHWGMVLMAAMSRLGLVKDWSKYSSFITRASEWFKSLGSDNGGMQINLVGMAADDDESNTDPAKTFDHIFLLCQPLSWLRN